VSAETAKIHFQESVGHRSIVWKNDGTIEVSGDELDCQLDANVTVDCADCGEPIRIGSWPFCRSAINPQGHERGCYGWHFGGK
jgi:hypothetical protein